MIVLIIEQNLKKRSKTFKIMEQNGVRVDFYVYVYVRVCVCVCVFVCVRERR